MQLKVKITKCLYPKVDTNDIVWRILSTDKGICKGKAPNVKPNEVYLLNGDYAEYKGQREYKFISADPYIPENKYEELVIASGMASGIGEKMVEKIWSAKGEDWKEIEVGDVKGFSDSKYQALQEAIYNLELNIMMTKTVSFLMSKGVTEGCSKKAYNEWGVDAIKLVSDNPYILTELPHVGFIEIDERVRHQFGIEDTSEFRIKACVFYSINNSLSSGDSLLSWRMFSTNVVNLLKIEPKLITDVVNQLLKDKKLTYFKDSETITTSRLFRFEKRIFDFLTGDSNATN